MTSKIRIKFGDIEVECEGSEDFLKKELPDLLETLSKFRGRGPAPEPEVSGRQAGATGNGVRSRTTGSVAQAIAAPSSGGGLLHAAAVKLTLIDRKDEFSRQEILDEMKSASGRWKTTYANNLSSYLQTAVKKKILVEARKDVYALATAQRTEAETKLAS
jgi:hypothetical protein